MGKRKANDWSEQFKPFAMKLGELQGEIRDWLETKTDEELAQIKADGRRRSQTNCWYLVYEVVPMVTQLADMEMYRRRRAAADATAGQHLGDIE